MAEKWVPKAGGRKPRRLRGFLWGVIAGLGLVLILLTTATIALEPAPVAIVVGASVVVGTLWSWVGPTKAA